MAEYYKHEIAKWNVATDNLTLEQEAAYHRVVSTIRLYERPLRHNLRVLAGMWRCNERKAERILGELIERGKLSLKDGLIIDEKAVEDASILRQSRIDKQSAGSRGGIESGKSRRKALKDNDTGEAPASTREEKRREEKEGDRLDKSNPPPSSAAEIVTDQFATTLARAVGYEEAPANWLTPSSKAVVAGWMGSGLKQIEILKRAKASRSIHPEPPATVQALSSFMGPSTRKPPAEAPASDAEIIDHWVKTLNGPGYVPQSAIKPNLARQIIATGLVDPERLKSRGIAF